VTIEEIDHLLDGFHYLQFEVKTAIGHIEKKDYGVAYGKMAEIQAMLRRCVVEFKKKKEKQDV